MHCCRYSALKQGVRSTTAFHTSDLWKHSYKPYDAAVVFGVAEMMGELKEKLLADMAPGKRAARAW